MGKHIVVADEDLLCLDEIGTVEFIIKSPVVESSSRHLLTPTTDHRIIVRKIFILAVYLPYMSLYHPNQKTLCQLVLHKHR